MNSAPGNLYPSAGDPLPVQTIDSLKIEDPVQQREVTLRLHVPDGPGPYPLVIFSHGSLCGAAMYDRLTAFWAARGYVIIMPQHLDALEAPPPDGPPDLKKLLSSRVRDMSFILDVLPELAERAGKPGVIDDNRIGAAGHSFGALTAMIKLGLALRPGEYQFDGATVDRRFAAGISMSGVGQLPPMTDNAFSNLTGPLLVTGGTLDEGNLGAGPVFPWEWRMSAYALAPAGDKYSVVLKDADHYLGGLIARDDRGGDADHQGVDILAAVSSAFLDAFVGGQPAAREWLATANLAKLTNGRARYEHK